MEFEMIRKPLVLPIDLNVDPKVVLDREPSVGVVATLGRDGGVTMVGAIVDPALYNQSNLNLISTLQYLLLDQDTAEAIAVSETPRQSGCAIFEERLRTTEVKLQESEQARQSAEDMTKQLQAQVEAKRESPDLEKLKNDYQKQVSRAVQEASNARQTRQELETLKRTFDELRISAAQVDALTEQLQTNRKSDLMTIQALQTEKQKQNEEFEKAKQDFESRLNSLTLEIESAGTRYRAQMSETVELKNKLENVQKQLKVSEDAKLKAEKETQLLQAQTKDAVPRKDYDETVQRAVQEAMNANTAKKKLEEFKNECGKLKQSKEEVDAMVQKLRKQLDDKKKSQNDTQKSEIKALQEECSKKATKYENEKKALTDRLEKLSSEFESAKKSNQEQSRTCQTNLSKCDEDRTLLIEKLTNLETSLQNLRNEKSTFEKELVSAKQELGTSKQKLSESENRMRELEKQKVGKEKADEEELALVRKTLEENRAKCETMRQKYEEKLSQITKLNNDLNMETQKLQGPFDEVQTLLRDQVEKNKTLELELKKNKRVDAELSDLKQTLQTLSTKLQDKDKEIETAKKNAEQLQNELEEASQLEIEELKKSQTNIMNSEIQKVREELERKQKEYDEMMAQKDSIQQECDEKLQTIARINKELESSTNQLQNTFNDTKTLLDEQLETNKTLKQESVAELAKANESLSELSIKLKQTEEELQNSKRSFEELKSTKSEEIAQKQSEFTELNESIQKLESEKMELTKQIRVLNIRVTEEQQKNKLELEMFQKNSLKLKDQETKLKDLESRLRTHEEQCQNETQTLEQTFKTQRALVEKQQIEVQSKDNEIVELKRKISESESKITESSSNVEEIKKQLDNGNQEKEQLKTQISKCAEQNRIYENQIRELQGVQDKMIPVIVCNSQKQVLEDQIQSLKTEKGKLQAELNTFIVAVPQAQTLLVGDTAANVGI